MAAGSGRLSAVSHTTVRMPQHFGCGGAVDEEFVLDIALTQTLIAVGVEKIKHKQTGQRAFVGLLRL